MISTSVMKRLTISRFFFVSSKEYSTSSRDVAAFAAIHSLQDSLEFFLLAAAEHLNASIGERTDLSGYIDKVNERLTPRSLPFRIQLLQLNRLRTSAKHAGIRPDAGEMTSLLMAMNEFYEEASQIIFGRSFFSVTLLDQIDDRDEKSYLSCAEDDFSRGDYWGCMINCRKAFFTIFESSYDISYLEHDSVGGLFAGLGCYSPAYAKNKDYVERNVRSNFDFIVLDHQRIDLENSKMGVDGIKFWNIWRLTPEVYKLRDGEWLVRNSFEKQMDATKSNAEYVLDATIEIVVAYHIKQRSLRWTSYGRRRTVGLKGRPTPIYSKAARSSTISTILDSSVVQIDCIASVTGFDGDVYFEVSDFKGKEFYAGFIHSDDVTE